MIEQTNEIKESNSILENTIASPQIQQEAKKVHYFHKLLIGQILCILLTQIFLKDTLFVYEQQTYPRANTTFDQYCVQTNRCRQHFYYLAGYKQYDLEEYYLWKSSLMIPEVNYSLVYKFSIISYPLFLFFTSILKNKWIIREKQRKVYYINTILLSIFLKAISSQLTKQDDNIGWLILSHIRGYFISLLINLIILQANRSIKKLQYKLTIKIVLQKLVNIYFIVLSIHGFTGYRKINFIPQLLLILVQQIHLIYLEENLFFNEQYKDISLIMICKNKIKSYFEIADVYQNIEKNYLVVPKKSFYFGLAGIILVSSCFNQLLSLQAVGIIGVIVSLLIWDTSLISTTSKITYDDQYLAASLFHLDAFMPLRNILQIMII